MSFSSIAVQQREKEAKALKSFLVFSFIGSLMLHIGVLASGIGNLFDKLPSEEEPIEFTIVEPATLETADPPEETKKETPKEKPIDNTSILSAKATTDSTNNTEVLPVPKFPQPLVKVEKQPTPQPKPVVQKLQPEPVKEQPKPVATQPTFTTEPQKPVVQQPENTPNSRPNPTIATNTSSASAPVQNNTQPSNENLRQVLSGVRDSRNSQGSTVANGGGGGGSSVATTTGNGTGTIVTGGSGTGTGSGTASGSGSGTGTGTGSGNGSGTGRQNVATAPTPPKLQTSSGNGRAACRQCDSKYPEDARRRGVEGRVEVAVDTDAQGNVTKVRIIKSSGNRKLDEEHLNQARNWKLKPSDSGRQGVAIATEYALQGSRRYRNVKKRQRQREEQQRNQQATSNSASTPQQTSRRRRRFTSGTIVDVPPEVRTRQQNTSTSSSSNQTTSNQTTSNQTTTSQPTTPTRRLHRQRVETPSQSTNQTTPKPRQQQQQVAPNNPTPATQSTRRRRTEINTSSGSSSNQTQLRQSLRRFKQQSAPVVPASPPPSSNGE
ncbi:TonB family protein [Pelatocladus sp. BLCC-F211]|uniref:energy transducer TonB n=1 Tax=Pelatocladus sp. BLCC-F211 TaxID=3342752 RepID=UPI0035B98284